MWGYVTIGIGITVLFFDLYFAWISCGFLKNNTRKCKGYLVNTLQQRDVYVGGKGGRFHKHYLDYEYVYRVNGKEYRISGGVPGTKANLRQSVDIVYQSRKPQLAYIRDLTIPYQPITAILLCPVWIGLIIIGLLLL